MERMAFSVMVFPLPLSPMKAMVSLLSRDSDMSFKIYPLPSFTVRLLISRTLLTAILLGKHSIDAVPQKGEAQHCYREHHSWPQGLVGLYEHIGLGF